MSSSNIIRNLVLEYNSFGINSEGNCGASKRHKYNLVINNTIRHNTEGIRLFRSQFNNVTQNIIQNNSLYGVHLTYSAFDNIIFNNTFNQTGIQYDYTNDNEYCLNDNVPNVYLNGATGPPCGCLPLLDGLAITSQEVICQDTYNLPNGIEFPKDTNGINLNCNGSTLIGTGGENGIHLIAANNLIIEDCIIKNYSNGIFIDWRNGGVCRTSNFNTIRNVILENNSVGINSNANCGSNSLNKGNVIINNTIRYNAKGIRIYGCELTNITQNIIQGNSDLGLEATNVRDKNNLIFLNSFVNNNASDSGVDNNWNVSGQGNYWNDYDTEAEGCFDTDSDFICDTPFNISGSSGSKDYLPLTGIQILDIIPIQVIEGVDMVLGKTTLVRSVLKNTGVSDKNINVTLYFDGVLRDNNTAFIGAGEEINVDLTFIPDVAGSDKEIRVEVEET